MKELFSDYRQHRSSLLYPFVFFIRRFSIILVITLMPGLKYVQIWG